MAKQGASKSSPAVGRIGRYRLLQELARGGMSQVFVARKDGAREVCVLKKLLVSMESHETASIRFSREANLAKQLDHPNIARTLDAGIEDGTLCMEMEFIPGQTVEAILFALMRLRRIPPVDFTVAIILAVLEGLAYAHELRGSDGQALSIVHRDMSPRNIMVTYDGHVKIIDFGIAHGRVDDFRTAPGAILGTFSYMSPEQALGQGIDPRSDLYSLGVVMHELLSGRLLVPYADTAEMIRAVVQDKPQPIRQANPDVPPKLEAVLSRALEKEPSRRWSNAREFRNAILKAHGAHLESSPKLLTDMLRDLFPAGEAEAQAVMGHRGATSTLDDAVIPTDLTSLRGQPTEPQTRVTEPLINRPGTDSSNEQTAVVRRRTTSTTGRGELPTAIVSHTVVPVEMPVTRPARPRNVSTAGSAEDQNVALAEQIRRLERNNKLLVGGVAGAILLLMFVLGLMVALVLRPEPQPLAPIQPSPAQPTHPAAQAGAPAPPPREVPEEEVVDDDVEAVEEVTQPEKVEEPAPRRRTRRVVKKPAPEPDPPASPPPGPSHAAVRRLASKLEANPKDFSTYSKLAAELRKASKSLPASKQKRVTRLVKRSETLSDPELLLEAARILTR